MSLSASSLHTPAAEDHFSLSFSPPFLILLAQDVYKQKKSAVPPTPDGRSHNNNSTSSNSDESKAKNKKMGNNPTDGTTAMFLNVSYDSSSFSPSPGREFFIPSRTSYGKKEEKKMPPLQTIPVYRTSFQSTYPLFFQNYREI